MTAYDAPTLSNSDISELTEWRRMLHRNPELSGEERETALQVQAMLAPTLPDEVIAGLGGHGVAAVYQGAEPGPTVMVRCELDALPIEELGEVAHRSTVPGKGHLCGHDGHMAIMAATARWLGRNRPTRGRAIVLFQPAEEDGSGAAKVLEDARFAALAPDYALSVHNFPGLALGHAVLAAGPMNCASRGMKITLTGRTAHASQPENGVSPAPALATLIPTLTALSHGTRSADPHFALATVTHARLGEPAFGIAPGFAEVWVTLRTQKDDAMADLVARAEAEVHKAAGEGGVKAGISYHDVFHHCENHPEATQILMDALQSQSIPVSSGNLPMRASEDFGRFGACAKSAMFLLGSGTDSPSLHNPDYDFPDTLIPLGARIFVSALRTKLY